MGLRRFTLGDSHPKYLPYEEVLSTEMSGVAFRKIPNFRGLELKPYFAFQLQLNSLLLRREIKFKHGL